MPFTLSPLSLTSWQRRVLVQDYFAQAGYTSDLESGQVFTRQGDLKYRIKGTENPLKVASTLMVTPTSVSPAQDFLFSHRMVQRQAQWQEAMQQAMVSIDANDEMAVVEKAIALITGNASIKPGDESTLAALLVASYSSPQLKEVKEKASQFRHNKDAQRSVVDVLVKTVDWSRMADFSGGVADPMARRERRVQADASVFHDYVIGQAKSHAAHGLSGTQLALSLQHAAAKSGLTLVSGELEAPSRFTVLPEVTNIMKQVIEAVQHNKSHDAESLLSGVKLTHDPLLNPASVPFEQVLHLGSENAKAQDAFMNKLQSGSLGAHDQAWVLPLINMTIKQNKSMAVDSAEVERLLEAIPVSPAVSVTQDIQSKENKEDVMRTQKELLPAVAFLKAQRGAWEGTPVSQAVEKFFDDVSGFDGDAKRAWPVDALHRAVAAHIESRSSTLTPMDIKLATDLAQKDASWKQVVMQVHKRDRINNIRNVDEMLNVMVAVDVLALSKEAGVLTPHAVTPEGPAGTVHEGTPEEGVKAEPDEESLKVVDTPAPEPEKAIEPVDFTEMLDEAMDKITEAMWRNDDLVLPDESDWFQKRWEQCVESATGDDKVKVAYDVFGTLMESPSKKAIKAWYLDDADHEAHASRLLEVAAKIEAEVGDIPGVRDLLAHHVDTLSVVPGVISRAVDVNAVSRAADGLAESLKVLAAQPRDAVQEMVSGITEQVNALSVPVSPDDMPWFNIEKASELGQSQSALINDLEALMKRFYQVPVGEAIPSLGLPDAVAPAAPEGREVAEPEMPSRKRA